MRVTNTALVAMQWNILDLPILKGTPISMYGVLSNDENAIGIVMEQINFKTDDALFSVMNGGMVDLSELDYKLSEEAMGALAGITFFKGQKAFSNAQVLVGVETEAREEADTALQNNIDTVDGKIGAEATARTNADDALSLRVDTIQAAVGTPLVAATAADMTDTDKIYVYVGEEEGYTAGNWYYYDSTDEEWVSGGVYNSTAFETDPTLSIAGMAADAAACGDLKSAINAIQTDRSEGVFTFNTSEYDLRRGYLDNGVYNPNTSSQVVTYKFIDCRGAKFINFDSGERYIIVSWYSAPSESAFIKRDANWRAKATGISIVPEGAFMRFGVRNPSGTSIQPEYAAMNITFTGIDAYKATVEAKSIPGGFSVVDCYDGFVRGTVSYENGDTVIDSVSRISSDYIDLSGKKLLHVSIGSGYTYNLLCFNAKGGAAAYYSGFTADAETYDVSDYAYVKVVVEIGSGVCFPGEAIALTVSAKFIDTVGSQYEAQTFSGTSIKADFLAGAKLHIVTDETANVLVSNGNFLDPAGYEDAPVTKNGITFTVDADGCVTANGTATGNADFAVRKLTEPTIVFDNTPWCLSGQPEGSTPGSYFIYTTNHGDNDGYGAVDDDTNIGYVYIRIKAGVTVNNLKFYPMLTIGRGKSAYKRGRVDKYVGTDFEVDALLNSETQIASDKIMQVTGYATRYKAEAQNRNFEKYKKPYFLAIGHRGLLMEAPENTIYAFRAAVEASLDIMESDIQFTSDHVPVMFHDSTIDRVVNGHTGKIRDYTWAEVQTFDVYSYFEAQYPAKWKPEFVNARIMSLDEYLAFCKGVGIPSCLEIKSTDFTHDEIMTVISLLEKYNYVDQVLWGGTFNTVRGLYPILHKYPESCAVIAYDNTALTTDSVKKLKLVDTGENAFGVSLSAQAAESIAVVKGMGIIVIQYMIDNITQALAVDPCVTGMMSNSLNVRTLLKSHYMGE